LDISIRPYEPLDEHGVVALWREVFPNAPAHNDPVRDIQAKLTVQPELFFVALRGDCIVVGSTTWWFIPSIAARAWALISCAEPKSRCRSWAAPR